MPFPAILNRPPSTSYMPDFTSISRRRKSSATCTKIQQSLSQSSLISPIVINKTLIAFTLDSDHPYAVYFNQTLFTSLYSVLENLNLTKKIPRSLHGQIAILANFLSTGDEYKYVENTAYKQDYKFHFVVKKDSRYWQVYIRSIKSDDIEYTSIEPHEINYHYLSYSTDT